MGKAVIKERSIHISNYPFQPSLAFPERSFSAQEIQAVGTDFGPCRIYVGDDIIFITAEEKEHLIEFAQRNAIELRKHSWNWDWILEPYLDTELTEDDTHRIQRALHEVGIGPSEIRTIRNEVGKQMYRYNFDTMLWEWCSLGLHDVLSAMRVTYTATDFENFYRRAIEIDQRKKKP